jgi:glutamyl-tRNA reductase
MGDVESAVRESLKRIISVSELAIEKKMDEIVKKQSSTIIQRIITSLETEAKLVSSKMLEEFKEKLKNNLQDTNMKTIEDIFANNIKDILQEITNNNFKKGGSRKYTKKNIKKIKKRHIRKTQKY